MSISAHLNKRKINLLSFRKEESVWRELIHSLEPHAQYESLMHSTLQEQAKLRLLSYEGLSAWFYRKI
jgi:hypothetical protein